MTIFATTAVATLLWLALARERAAVRQPRFAPIRRRMTEPLHLDLE